MNTVNLTTRWKAPVALGVAGAAVIAAGGFGLMKAGVFRNDNDEYTAAPITNATLAQISISNGSTGVAPTPRSC